MVTENCDVDSDVQLLYNQGKYIVFVTGHRTKKYCDFLIV